MLSGRAGCFYQKHGFPDAHGWVFSRIVYSCSAAYCLVFDAPPAQRIDADFFASGKLCGRMSHDGLAWYAKNLEIREICGRQLSAQCAKEQAGCFILPRISQISTDAMRTGGGLNGFPHYETRAISFSPRNRLAAFSPYIYDKKLLEFVRVQQLHYRFIRYQIPSLEQVA